MFSPLGFRNQIIWGAAAFGLLPILLGAVAWTLPTRRQRDFVALTRQRNVLLICLALLLSAPHLSVSVTNSVSHTHSQFMILSWVGCTSGAMGFTSRRPVG